jgi:hypothetical protein
MLGILLKAIASTGNNRRTLDQSHSVRGEAGTNLSIVSVHGAAGESAWNTLRLDWLRQSALKILAEMTEIQLLSGSQKAGPSPIEASSDEPHSTRGNQPLLLSIIGNPLGSLLTFP